MDEKDVHPSVDEIKPYVAIGPTKDYSITLHKKTFDSAFIMGIIAFVIGILIILGVSVFFAFQQSALPPPPPPLEPLTQPATMNSNLGAVSYSTAPIGKNMEISPDGSDLTTKQKCESVSNTIWNGTECRCQAPFFGSDCSREKHDSKYYAVGIPNEETLQVTVLNEMKSDGKSFNDNGDQNSCSQNCNMTDGCIGFIYHSDTYANTCKLLGGNVIVPEGSGMPYSNAKDSTLYLRSSDNLHFEGRIFLGEYVWSFPPRSWLVKEIPGFIQLYPNIISKISFAPAHVKIYGSYTGIYCTHPFSLSDINIILDKGPTSECYIHEPGTLINLPPDWKYKIPIYVVYI